MVRFALLVLGLTAPISAILPEIVDSGISQILEDNSSQGQTALNNMYVEVEQLMEDTQQKPVDAVQQSDNESGNFSLHPHNLPSSHHNESGSEKEIGNQSVQSSETVEQGTNNITRETETHLTTTIQSSGKENNIYHECIIDEDCEKGRYCLYETHNSKCLPCKAIDVPCTKDEECCGEQLCVWGQCSQNATKGEPGSICQYQNDCSTDLCCAFHKALLFPVCSAKPIERERCLGASNHLMELLSWDMDGEGPREHCPCAGDLQCQPLGRGSLCLKGQDSSEEDLTDSLYSEIDYIV
ncbi:dickkopf-related protein 3a [Centroberyx affinis]|uniref:dickkopf-related protein 3a n=1 Tax=Centroberyx affinis TaxID=166261 RepID=UPI003A5C080C